MNKKQWNTFGFMLLILAAYFYIWSILDGLAGFEADTQRFICIILAGLTFAFFRCAKLESKK